MMKNMIKKGLAIGFGLAIFTKEQAEKFADELIEKGQMNKDESREFVQALMQKGEEVQKQLDDRINNRFYQLKDQLDLASKEEVEQLKQRIERLEALLNQR